MSTQRVSPRPPAPHPGGTAAPVPATPPAPARGGLAARLRTRLENTPGRYRLWSAGAALILVVAVVLAAASARSMQASTHTAEVTSGPVLVDTQQVISSLAAADAAATSAFLSTQVPPQSEDPEQRRLYEQALAQSGQEIEQIAALGGSDPAIPTEVSAIQVQLTQYAGLVEAARAAAKDGSASANGYLTSAVQLAGQLVSGPVADLATTTQADLQRDQDRRGRWLAFGVIALVLALAVLGAGQYVMAQRSHRLVNVPLALATLLTLAAGGWLLFAGVRSGSDMSRARQHGYDSIVLTAKLGGAGFGAKAAESLGVITGDTSERATADDNARQVAVAPIIDQVPQEIRQGGNTDFLGGYLGQLASAADNARERAAVAETAVRWQRYGATVAALRAAPSPTAAKVIATGQLNSDFNGFNFSVETILGQNRDQFIGGLTSAATATSRVPVGVILLLVIALGAMFWGYQLRINEYL